MRLHRRAELLAVQGGGTSSRVRSEHAVSYAVPPRIDVGQASITAAVRMPMRGRLPDHEPPNPA